MKSNQELMSDKAKEILENIKIAQDTKLPGDKRPDSNYEKRLDHLEIAIKELIKMIAEIKVNTQGTVHR